MRAPRPKNFSNPLVTLDTSLGNIYLEVFQQRAPITANNFLDYVAENFYDNTIFHRVINNFMIQGGGYTVRPFEEKKVKAPIPLESKVGLHNFLGTVAMARTTDPNSATSQFFINLANNFFLDYGSPVSPGYAVFARVVEGLDIARAIAKVELFPESTQPKEDVAIESTEITLFFRNNRDKYKIAFIDGEYWIGTNSPSQELTHAESLQFRDRKVWLSQTMGDVEGSENSEIIFGDAKDNKIMGAAGDDEINGLEGRNELTGGLGSDRFILTTSFTESQNTIIDFASGIDRILISKSLLGDAYKSVPRSLSKDFIAGSDPIPLDKTDRFLYNYTTGSLMFDPDGSDSAPAIEFLTLTGQPNLVASDLLIIA